MIGLSGCSATGGDIAGGDADIIPFMLTPEEAIGWSITADHGPVDGDSPDCTGAPYDWPDLTIIANASQFLDRRDETVGVVLKRLDGDASVQVEALRGALAPCAPASGEVKNGAMIKVVGDDSFAYQSVGSDESGNFAFSNMLVACGDLILETTVISYSSELDQAGLERLVAPVVGRMSADQGCSR